MSGSSSDPFQVLHRALPDYAPTPLVEVPALASQWQVRRVLVKAETSRLGLPSFKILGASWAVYQELLHRHGLAPTTPFEPTSARRLGSSGPRLVTATDGNHGRAVARAATYFGLPCRVFLPRDAVQARIDAIRDEGADVCVVDGDYDHACAAAADALDDSACLMSDTSWPGHDRVPRWISQGYGTMFREVDEQAPADRIDAVIVPVGVGALAAAVVAHYADRIIVGVEPDDANCVGRSLQQGRLVTAPGPHLTAMVGLNCGTPSDVAWPWVRDGFDAMLTVTDADATAAMRFLAEAGIPTGATGAAAAAGAARLLAAPEPRGQLGISGDSTILVLVTEGVTDPEHYAAAVRGVSHPC